MLSRMFGLLVLTVCALKYFCNMSKTHKKRDPYAIPAKQRSGAGGHGDKKKEEDKSKCRKKISKEKGEENEKYCVHNYWWKRFIHN